MMSVIEEGDIVLSAHVVDRYRERELDSGDRRPFTDVHNEILELIRESMRTRANILDHKPKVFRLYRESRRKLPPSERFLHCGRIGFILRQTTSGAWVVTTMLHRTGGTPER